MTLKEFKDKFEAIIAEKNEGKKVDRKAKAVFMAYKRQHGSSICACLGYKAVIKALKEIDDK